MSGHFVSTRPACRACRYCGRLELVGLDEGLPYRAEPAPLTLLAELRVRLTGRRSYVVINGELAYRNATRIAGDSRGRPPVLAEHNCAHPATATDIDTTPEHLHVIRQLIRVKSDPLWGKVCTDTESALFTVTGQLNGRVVAFDPPPF